MLFMFVGLFFFMFVANVIITFNIHRLFLGQVFFSGVGAYTISMPLIAVIIIGDYTKSILSSIPTTNRDYYNLISAFNHVVCAQNSKNGI